MNHLTALLGYETRDSVLGAREGKTMNGSMATDNAANDFNILGPGENEVAMFTGSMAQKQYEGTLPAWGDYKAHVSLECRAARRDEVAQYRLERYPMPWSWAAEVHPPRLALSRRPERTWRQP